MLKKHLRAGIILIAIVLVFSFALRFVVSPSGSSEIVKTFNEGVALHKGLRELGAEKRKEVLLEAEDRFLGTTIKSPDQEIKGIGFYDTGTAYLEEFLRDENISYIERAIIFLTQSARISPKDTEVRKRAEINLRIAWDLVEERGWQDTLRYLRGGDEAADKFKGPEIDQTRNIKKIQKEGGISETKIPYWDEDIFGFGQGEEPWDY